MKILLFLLLFTIPICGQTPAALESELIDHLDEMSKHGTYGGDYDDDKHSAASVAFKKTLLKAVARKDTLTYPFAKLKEKMGIVTSRDGRLRVYSWDLESGGTMHDYDMIVQYAVPGGAVKFTGGNGEDYEGSGAFYHDIFQLTAGLGKLRGA